MKLFSTNRNKIGNQLVCEDAVFDPDFIMSFRADTDENFVSFKYDFTECGHPLNLPFEASAVEFLVKFTKHDIHICAMVEVEDAIGGQFEDFVGDLGEIEFDVRMTDEEKYDLLLALFHFCFQK